MLDPSGLTALVLAGGRGTRLASAIADLPKALAPVGGRPFAERIALALRDRGVRRLVFCTGWGASAIEEHFGDGRRLGLDVSYSREHEPLGTGGALRLAMQRIPDERVLAVNGDSWCPVKLARLARVHEQSRARATIWSVGVGDTTRYGTIAAAPDGRVESFVEKGESAPGAAASGRINAGIYLFERSVLAEIPEGRAVSLETEVLPALVGRGLFSADGDGPFLDIGTPESYRGAEDFFASVGAA